jgi:hypothetical protein
MGYGDGDGTILGPLANSLDVTAHELTHGHDIQAQGDISHFPTWPSILCEYRPGNH